LDSMLERNRIPPVNEVQKYKDLDAYIRDKVRKEYISLLEERIPRNSYIPNSEASFLERESAKKRRIRPLREIFNETRNMIFLLKPCFMMSPLSVSQYIDPEYLHFDVVIFDEASQIMPEEAVSCLMRADQAIIAGDTKQLPPTTFFEKFGDNITDDEYDEDLESFLAEATSIFGKEYLKWHYRSKNEELIAFSNKKFYNNGLITFPPSSINEESGIEFVYVKDGVYDRGGSRKNLREAEEVAKIYKEIKEKYSNKSVGIIAFSIQQEEAIRNVLEKEAVSIDLYDDSEDYTFIKNLETVQGDERDIVILSIGYGRDSEGKFICNFGPLNSKEGYKRLNVAITRARYKVFVVSSIEPEEIDESRLTSQGGKYLKHYLLYARDKSFREMMRIQDNPTFDSPFEESVFNTLIVEGFDIVTQVGSSSFRIDIAIKHPKKIGKFILGIECDGAQYHSSRFARDRDKVRQQILESLGWRLHRIWSTDWFRNPKREIEKIKEVVKKISEEDNNDPATVDDPPQDMVEKISIERINRDGLKRTKLDLKPYVFAQIPAELKDKLRRAINSRNFNAILEIYKLIIKEIIIIEAPIKVDFVFTRLNSLLEASDFYTIGKEDFNWLIKKVPFFIVDSDGTVSYNSQLEDYYEFRKVSKDLRPFSMIPKVELAGLIVKIIEASVGTEEESLISAVAEVATESKRSGKNMKEQVMKSLKYLKNKKIVEEIKGRMLIARKI